MDMAWIQSRSSAEYCFSNFIFMIFEQVETADARVEKPKKGIRWHDNII